eukprot:6280571-Amphidinium_carterae.2
MFSISHGLAVSYLGFGRHHTYHLPFLMAQTTITIYSHFVISHLPQLASSHSKGYTALGSTNILSASTYNHP